MARKNLQNLWIHGKLTPQIPHTMNLQIVGLFRVTFELFFCPSSIIIVSTLDGKLSALDARQNGRIRWSLPAFSGPLLSSSLSSLQVSTSFSVIIYYCCICRFLDINTKIKTTSKICKRICLLIGLDYVNRTLFVMCGSYQIKFQLTPLLLFKLYPF